MSLFAGVWPPSSALTISPHPEGVQLMISGPGMVTSGIVISVERGMELAGEIVAHCAPELAAALAGDPIAAIEGVLSKMGKPEHAFTAGPPERCPEIIAVGVTPSADGRRCDLPKGHLGPHQVRTPTDPGVLS